PCKALEATLRTEAIKSVDTGISPFLEAMIIATTTKLEKFYVNLAHETHSGSWYTDCEVEGHVKDSCPWRK
ncbi:hypothetical protein KI387_036946, partial [Taxus chinensis]